MARAMRPFRAHRLFQAAGLLALLLIALRTYAFLPAERGGIAARIVLGILFLLFGAAFLWTTRGGPPLGRTGPRVAVLAAQTLICITTHTDLLTLLAAELPFVLRPRAAALWMGAQALVSAGVAAGLLALGGFQADSGLERAPVPLRVGLTLVSVLAWQFLCFCGGLLAASEGRERRELARLNGELVATRALLAESSRLIERTQISRELHDTLGHHLTVLSVNLELAKHLVEGRAAAPIAEAQGVTRLLLSDVRAVVSRLREEAGIDLYGALTTLAAATTEPKVELAPAPRLTVAEPAKAHALFRCAQEAITNAVRHSEARHLRLLLEAERGGVALRISDDGRGADPIRPGNGLTGMRERLEEVGGSLVLASGPGRGFELRAWVPGPAGVPPSVGAPRSVGAP